MENSNDKNVFEAIAKDRGVRQTVARDSHLMFFHIYFPHYVKYEIAEFQKEIFRITEDATNKLACIVAFRGSGKSTLVTFSYSLWAILGRQQKKFVLIVCQTQAQARQQMANLKFELENNPLLKSDMGPFREEDSNEQWAISSLVFQNGARIMIASLEQSIRGVRHHEYRPDLIILDDIEDMASTKTMEGRQKTFDWFTREIIPLGDVGTRIVLVGNLLHEDSLMMRLRKKIEAKEIQGIYRWFPLVSKDGECLWKGKFDTQEKIEELRMSVANELAWRQEYLLEIISDSTRVIHPEWIQYYDKWPIPELGKVRKVIIGVDLAISLRDSADYSAMVMLATFGYGSSMKAYVMRHPFHKKLPYAQLIEEIRGICREFKNEKRELPLFVVESNGFQEAYVETMTMIGARVKGVKHMNDKRSRLALTSSLIRTGNILFPKNDPVTEILIAELTGFSKENHDDLADAFSTAVLQMIEDMHGSRGYEAWQNWVINENGGSCML